jgi:hypothetical protein
MSFHTCLICALCVVVLQLASLVWTFVEDSDDCRAMLPEERKDLSSFRAAARQKVADQVGCTVQQVHVCIAPYSNIAINGSLRFQGNFTSHLPM